MVNQAAQQGVGFTNDAAVDQLLLYATDEQRLNYARPYPPAAIVAQQLDARRAQLIRFQPEAAVAAVKEEEEEEEEVETNVVHKKRIKCFNCGEFGHIAQYCPKKRKKQNQGKKRCGNKTQQEGQFVVCTQIGTPLQYLMIRV